MIIQFWNTLKRNRDLPRESEKKRKEIFFLCWLNSGTFFLFESWKRNVNEHGWYIDDTIFPHKTSNQKKIDRYFHTSESYFPKENFLGNAHPPTHLFLNSIAWPTLNQRKIKSEIPQKQSWQYDRICHREIFSPFFPMPRYHLSSSSFVHSRFVRCRLNSLVACWKWRHNFVMVQDSLPFPPVSFFFFFSHTTVFWHFQPNSGGDWSYLYLCKQHAGQLADNAWGWHKCDAKRLCAAARSAGPADGWTLDKCTYHRLTLLSHEPGRREFGVWSMVFASESRST
jgi:hypothetical protein